MVEEPYKSKVVSNLIKDIIEFNHTDITTGNQCTKYIFDVFTESRQLDVAYDLVEQITYPSWGYMIKNGATTTWER